ncbi:hypothetical protein VZT92_006035 [Zoarces viviparus]|uniref:Uncharacterized protein n=2 Tax=Zoarces viviparus TaxID=48416 RepID=A0AAW1FQ04_ZOAVI
MDSQKPVNKQASQIAALKQKMAAKELSWEQEKQKILTALKLERDCRKLAKLEKDFTNQERDEIIDSLRQSLLENQKESAEFNQVVESLKEENKTFKKNWEKDNAKFEFDKKNMDLEAKRKAQQERQTILDLESYATQKDNELIRSEAEWKIKLTALEDRMRSELAAKEESFQREQELQRQSREMEEEWRNQKEEEIKLLTQQNADLQLHNRSLQELAQQNDKEKAQFKKEEKVRQTVLSLESYATQKDSELIRSEAEWEIKLTALEDLMRSEFAAKEESFQREQELQRQSREMEEDWRNQKEEEIKLLTQQNADLQLHNRSLQELAQQNDKEKAQFKEEKKVRQTVLSLESYATQKDSELIRSKEEWEIKLTALEDRMRSELAAKEESFQREQELQRQSREMEEEWRNQKEEIKLLTQQNADLQVHNRILQELAQQTDKEKAQFKKAEKKARKEAEKTLKKDRKEEEEREKKERNENEKRENEELKRKKKESKENEKREKEELKRQNNMEQSIWKKFLWTKKTSR